MREGRPIGEVIELLMAAKEQADVLAAHNIMFDHRIVWAEIIRSGRRPKSGMHKICTMMKGTKAANIYFNGKPKWPKLEELHFSLFQRNFEGAHDAGNDVAACRDCFFELKNRGYIQLPGQEGFVAPGPAKIKKVIDTNDEDDF